MKQKLIGLTQRYATALRKHLKQGSRASLQPALGLGRQAVALGLKTLDLARIHERALATRESFTLTIGRMKRAEMFFTEAFSPIEETHRAARQRTIDLQRSNETARRRTAKLYASNRPLRRGIVRRQSGESALKKGAGQYTSLLKESLHLQAGLRHLTHRNLSEHEKARQTVSRHLQNEIAQTLLGINVRLLNLKTAARGNTANLKKAITSTQRLVENSVKSINRFARELDIPTP